MIFRITFRIWKKFASMLVLRSSGLVISLFCIIILLTYIIHENSYDNHIKDNKNIYRVLLHNSSFSETDVKTPYFPKSLIINNLSEIKSLFRFIRLPEVFIINDDKKMAEKGFYCADPELFENFNIKIIEGTVSSTDFKHFIAISQKISSKYFADGNAIGKVVTIKQSSKELSAVIVAIFENIPENSTFHADIIGNFQLFFDLNGKDYNSEPYDNLLPYTYFNSFILVDDANNPDSIATRLTGLLYPKSNNSDISIQLQNLQDVYLGSKDLVNNDLPSGSKINIRLFLVICIVIVIIALSNFTLITVTLHFNRRREYFIRSSLGASKSDLLKVISFDISLLIILCICVVIILYGFLNPFVSDLFGKEINLENSIILNESAAKHLQIQNITDKRVAFKEVIGIAKDFPILSLFNKITPLYIFPVSGKPIYLIIKYAGDKSLIIKYLEDIKNISSYEIKLFDLQSIINETYFHERKMNSIFLIFTIITIFLGVIGISGYLMFFLKNKRKELTIRRIHGASFFQIAGILSKDFLIAILVSNVITYPLIWYFANEWLNGFAYHIKIGAGYFLVGTFVNIILCLGIVFFTTYRQISQNPLRTINS
jgi:hypothetical protein